MSDLNKINTSFSEKIKSIKSKDELQNLKTEFLGKNGQITSEFKTAFLRSVVKNNLFCL